MRRGGEVLEYPPVPFFLNISRDLDGPTIEIVPLVVWDSRGCLLPPINDGSVIGRLNLLQGVAIEPT